MALSFTQTDTVGGAGVIAACSGLSVGATSPRNWECQNGATAGSSALTVANDNAFTDTIYIVYECIVGAGVTWDAGTWTVRMNVTAANADVTWSRVYICRVNSSNVNQATIGSNTSVGVVLDTTGVKSTTVSGSSQTPSVGDKVLVILAFTDTSVHGGEQWTVLPNQDIDSPFTAIVNTNITPDTGSLTLTGNAPSPNMAVTVPVGTVALTGHAPTVSELQDTQITPPAGSIVATGHAATLDTGYIVPAGSISSVGYAPLLDIASTPTTGSLVLAGEAVTVLTPTDIIVPFGVLAVTGLTPTFPIEDPIAFNSYLFVRVGNGMGCSERIR